MQAIMPVTQANMDVIIGSQSAQGRLGIERLFADHKELVFRAAYRVTGNSTDAEDVLQTVFLRLLRLEQTPEIHYLRAYLHRAAVNAALDLLRARRENQNVPLDDQPEIEGTESTSRLQETGELRAWLREALSRLNPRWAEMFVLRFIEDYSNQEIARMMKTSAAVVAVALHRARAQLRKDYTAKMTRMRGTR
ncbi:MAG TPA: sigma-70 family RNA polymerase sigma factor [Candidatus Angelobacter sp.]